MITRRLALVAVLIAITPIAKLRDMGGKSEPQCSVSDWVREMEGDGLLGDDISADNRDVLKTIEQLTKRLTYTSCSELLEYEAILRKDKGSGDDEEFDEREDEDGVEVDHDEGVEGINEAVDDEESSEQGNEGDKKVGEETDEELDEQGDCDDEDGYGDDDERNDAGVDAEGGGEEGGNKAVDERDEGDEQADYEGDEKGDYEGDEKGDYQAGDERDEGDEQADYEAGDEERDYEGDGKGYYEGDGKGDYEGDGKGDYEEGDEEGDKKGDYEEEDEEGDYEEEDDEGDKKGDYEEGDKEGDYEEEDDEGDKKGDYEEGDKEGDYEEEDDEGDKKGDYEEGDVEGDDDEEDVEEDETGDYEEGYVEGYEKEDKDEGDDEKGDYEEGDDEGDEKGDYEEVDDDEDNSEGDGEDDGEGREKVIVLAEEEGDREIVKGNKGTYDPDQEQEGVGKAKESLELVRENQECEEDDQRAETNNGTKIQESENVTGIDEDGGNGEEKSTDEGMHSKEIENKETGYEEGKGKDVENDGHDDDDNKKEKERRQLQEAVEESNVDKIHSCKTTVQTGSLDTNTVDAKTVSNGALNFLSDANVGTHPQVDDTDARSKWLTVMNKATEEYCPQADKPNTSRSSLENQADVTSDDDVDSEHHDGYQDKHPSSNLPRPNPLDRLLHYTARVQDLEIKILQLENKLLSKDINANDKTLGLTKLENHFLKHENDLLKFNHTLLEIKFENDIIRKHMTKVQAAIKSQNESKFPLLSDVSREDILHGYQRTVTQLAGKLQTQTQLLEILENRTVALETQNKDLDHQLMLQSLLMSEIALKLNNLVSGGCGHASGAVDKDDRQGYADGTAAGPRERGSTVAVAKEGQLPGGPVLSPGGDINELKSIVVLPADKMNDKHGEIDNMKVKGGQKRYFEATDFRSDGLKSRSQKRIPSQSKKSTKTKTHHGNRGAPTRAGSTKRTSGIQTDVQGQKHAASSSKFKKTKVRGRAPEDGSKSHVIKHTKRFQAKRAGSTIRNDSRQSTVKKVMNDHKEETGKGHMHTRFQDVTSAEKTRTNADSSGPHKMAQVKSMENETDRDGGKQSTLRETADGHNNLRERQADETVGGNGEKQKTAQNLSRYIDKGIESVRDEMSQSATPMRNGKGAFSIPHHPRYHNDSHKQPRDCYDLYRSGRTFDSLANIHPVHYQELQVFCDMRNGGWTVLQRRLDGTVDFFRSWQEYKHGFSGKQGKHGEYWLGNDAIHHLTNQGNYRLRVDLVDWKREKRYAEYDYVMIEDESNAYLLHIIGFHGDAGDSLLKHNNQMFSTEDRDNDQAVTEFAGSCARRFTGGWWFFKCYSSNLNGRYYKGGDVPKGRYDGIAWKAWTGPSYSLKKVEIKIKPVD